MQGESQRRSTGVWRLDHRLQKRSIGFWIMVFKREGKTYQKVQQKQFFLNMQGESQRRSTGVWRLDHRVKRDGLGFG